MKNVLKSIMLIIVTTFMLSCDSSNSPEAVAEEFLVALGSQDYATARKLSTDRTVQLIKIIEGVAQMAKDSGNDLTKEKMPDINFTNTEINGDKATCYYSAEDGKEDKKINLVKVNGEWKVDMTKEM